MRHVSLSTCGIVPGIIKAGGRRAAGHAVRFTSRGHRREEKAVSCLTAAAYSVRQILDAANTYFKKTGRRIIIEYTLIIDGFNDSARGLYQALTDGP